MDVPLPLAAEQAVSSLALSFAAPLQQQQHLQQPPAAAKASPLHPSIAVNPFFHGLAYLLGQGQRLEEWVKEWSGRASFSRPRFEFSCKMRGDKLCPPNY